MQGYVNQGMNISTHAPRAGSDRLACWGLAAAGYFNPRSPCGERPSLRM